MTTTIEYERFAKECMDSARAARTDAERKAFLDMAKAWTPAAAKVNGGFVPAELAPPDDPGTGAPQ
jgi:hypothetical protein